MRFVRLALLLAGCLLASAAAAQGGRPPGTGSSTAAVESLRPPVMARANSARELMPSDSETSSTRVA